MKVRCMIACHKLAHIWKDKNNFSNSAPLFWKRGLPEVFLVVFLILTLAACSTGSTAPKAVATPTTPAQPTPTTLPPGTLLYQSDWSHGIAGWQVSTGWKINHGVLQSNSSKGNVITPSYIPTVPNYAIEVRFQIMSIPKSGGNVAVIADKAPGKDGYTAGI